MKVPSLVSKAIVIFAVGFLAGYYTRGCNTPVPKEKIIIQQRDVKVPGKQAEGKLQGFPVKGDVRYILKRDTLNDTVYRLPEQPIQIGRHFEIKPSQLLFKDSTGFFTVSGIVDCLEETAFLSIESTPYHVTLSDTTRELIIPEHHPLLSLHAFGEYNLLVGATPEIVTGIVGTVTIGNVSLYLRPGVSFPFQGFINAGLNLKLGELL